MLSSGTTNSLSSLFFTDANTGYVAGTNGTILKTTSGGLVHIEEIRLPESNFIIYPNPANGKINICDKRNDHGEIFVDVFSLQGEKIISENFPGQTFIEMMISQLLKGIYIVKIRTRGETEYKKLVIY